MADDMQMTVEMVARLDKLQSGLTEAVGDVTRAVDSIKEKLDQTGEAGEGMQHKMELALEGGIFLEYEEIAKQALEAVSEAFEKTAGKAMEFALTTSKFAAMMGSTTEHAAGLEAALNSVNISLQEYEQLAMRMQMRLKTQEDSFNQLGMATRDSNGELLQGEAMMQSAIKTMQEYKVGTDQNEFALQVFGRRAQDIYDIMRANKVEQEGYIKDMKALGMSTEDYSRSAVEMEAAMGRLKQMWKDLEIAIGQRLMPLMTEFFQWMHDDGIEVLQKVGSAVSFVIEEFMWFATTVDQVATVIAVPLAEMTDMVIGFSKVVYDVFTLNFSALKTDAKAAWDAMKADWKAGLKQLEADTEAYNKVVEALYGKKKKPEGEENVYAKGGGKSYVDPQAMKEAAKLADERAQSDEKLAMARIKNEEQADQAMLTMGKVTDDAFYRQAVALEERKYQAQKEFLTKKVANDALDKVAHLKDLDELKLLEETHVGALDKIYETHLERKQALDRQALSEFIQEDNRRLAEAMNEVEQEYKAHLISYDERADAERKLTRSIYGEELARYDQLVKTLTAGTAAYEKAMADRKRIADQMAKAESKITADQTNADMQKWHNLFGSITGSWKQTVNGLIVGTTSWSQAVVNVLSNVVESFLQMGEDILEKQAETWFMNEIMQKTSAAAGAEAQITADAAAAGAGAYAATAVIPYVGPELAPAAAATAYAGALSFAPLAFAEQGMLLDRDRLVFAHKEEQILPANLSKGLQGIIANGAGDKQEQRGGDTHVHVHGPFVQAIDTQTGAQFLMKNMPKFAKEMSKYISANPSARPRY